MLKDQNVAIVKIPLHSQVIYNNSDNCFKTKRRSTANTVQRQSFCNVGIVFINQVTICSN